MRKVSAVPLAGLLVVTLGGGIATAAPSTAPSPASGHGGTVTTTHVAGGGTLIAYEGPQTVDKHQWMATVSGTPKNTGSSNNGGSATGGSVQPDLVQFGCPWCHYYHTFSPDSSYKYASLSGNIEAYGRSSGESSTNAAEWRYVDFTNSTVTGCWWGTTPYYADGIAPSMKWWVSGVDISVGIPASVGFSPSGSGVTYSPGTVPHTNPYYCAGGNWGQDIHFSAASIANAYFTVATDFAISGQWYHVQGTATW